MWKNRSLVISGLSGGEFRSAGQFGEFFIPPFILRLFSSWLLLCHGTRVATHLSKSKSEPNKTWHKKSHNLLDQFFISIFVW